MDLEIYVVVRAKYYAWEGYDFPQILGLYFDKKLAEKDFPQPREDDERFETENWNYILGPYELK